MPKSLSLRDNYEETAAAFEQIREIGIRQHIPLMIRLDHVTNLDAAAALVLAAEIYRCRQLRMFKVDSRGFVSGTYPRDATVYSQLRDMGFFNMLEIGHIDHDDDQGPPEQDADPNRGHYLRFVTMQQVHPEFVDRFVRLIEKFILPMNELARQRLVGSIKEAMGNVTEHAYSQKTEIQSMSGRWYLCCKINPSLHEVMVILYDQGVGIPQTIDADLLDRLQAIKELKLTVTDGLKIKAATELGRSGTGDRNRGRGFRNMKQFVDVCTDGELRVLSNRGHYTYMSGTERHGDHSTATSGTVIEWRFRKEGILEVGDD